MLVRTTSVLALVAAIALAGSEEPRNPEAKIKQLREERLAVLRQIHDTVLEHHQRGTAGFGYDQVHQAKTELLRARLDLAGTKEDRIKIHEDLVGQAANWLRMVTALAETGAAGGSAIAVLKAKADHLEAQVALEQAKAGN